MIGKSLGAARKTSAFSSQRKWLGGTAIGAMCLASAGFAMPAFADEAEGAGMSEDVIIVTAQRRSESIQDVPVSVAAFSNETLETARVENVFDLQQLDPSLSLSAQSGAVIPFIRGIGNIASQTPGNESSVPVYIDDAYYSRLFVPYLAFADNIERVEVLKGPQGTLFGRNATGGLIHVVTKDPGQDTEFKVKVGYGSQETLRGQMYFATPLSDTLAIDFSASGQKMGDGFGNNLFNGKRTYFRDYFTLRSKLVWEPSEDTKVRLSGMYVYDNSSIGAVGGGGVPGFTRGLPADFDQAFDQPEGFWDINVNYDTERRHRGYALTGRIDQSLGFADMSSITFYRHSKEPWTSEGDHTNVRFLEYDLNVKDRQFTQELQLKSKEDSTISWILGLYYMDAFAAYDPTDIKGLSIEAGGLDVYTLIGKQWIESWAGFGQVTVPLGSDRTHVTGGLRYTEDKVRGRGITKVTPTGGEQIVAAPDYVDKANFDKVTYKISLDHDFSDDIMGYASYSRGYKSGVFNLLPLAAPAVPPEVVDAYEIGFKTTLADGKINLNAAAFWNDIKGLQTNIVIFDEASQVATVALASAGKARTRGFELSIDARPADGLSLYAGTQYVDATFRDFPNAPSITQLTEAPFGVTSAVVDASGFRLPQVPKWRFNAGFNYEIPSEVGDWNLAANLSYRGGFPWESDGVVRASDLALVNANLTWEPEFAPGASIGIWAKNLTNEKYYGNVLTQTGPAGVLASPEEGRTWGVEIGYRY